VRDERIHVLRVIDRLNVGGPAVHAVLTAGGLDPNRYRTTLVIGSIEPGEADMGYLLAERGIEPVVIPSLGRELRPLRDLKTAWDLWRVIRRTRPDVLHTHKAKAGALGRVVGACARIPVRVHTYHGHVFHGYFGARKTLAFLAIERTLGRMTSRLVALSYGLRDELAQRYRVAPSERFTVIPLGFDLRPFAEADQHRGALRRELGIKADERLVGIIGRMVPVKDHRTFVAAAARLAKRFANLRFVFVGGGELEEQVRSDLVAQGIASRAHLLGWRRQLERIYPDLDVVALSSLNEGTPVTLVEGMASGIPVAATRVGGVADVLQGGRRGELSPPKDPERLADAIERALSRAARDRAARQRNEVLAEYGIDRLCRDLESLYEELLGSRRRLKRTGA
jgi:glycosyltransferase involved in cell wall biosynthesis